MGIEEEGTLNEGEGFGGGREGIVEVFMVLFGDSDMFHIGILNIKLGSVVCRILYLKKKPRSYILTIILWILNLFPLDLIIHILSVCRSSDLV